MLTCVLFHWLPSNHCHFHYQLHITWYSWLKVLVAKQQTTTTMYSLALYRSNLGMYEQSVNCITLKKRPRCLCKVTHPGNALASTRQYYASSAELGWSRGGDCYLMHKMQSDYWLYSKFDRSSHESTVSLCPPVLPLSSTNNNELPIVHTASQSHSQETFL